MTISDQLDALRHDFPQCHTVGLADLSSGIVLCVSARKKHHQEQLDGYCGAATELFADASVAEIAGALGGDQPGTLQQAMIMTGSETRVFLRSATDPTEAMFCLCEAGADIDGLVIGARQRLGNIAVEQ